MPTPEIRTYVERVLDLAPDPLAVVTALARHYDREELLCFEGPEGWSCGFGSVATLRADRHAVTLRTTLGPDVRRGWSAGAVAAIPELLAALPLRGWRAYGWCGFDLGAAVDGRRDLAGDAPFVHLVLPEVEVRFADGTVTLRALAPADLDEAETVVRAARPVSSRAVGSADRFPLATASRAAYESAVAEATGLIDKGELRKLVLSRRVPLPGPVDLVATFASAHASMTATRSFLCSVGGVQAAGMSPESVVRVEASGAVVSELVAGTRARTGDRDGDARRARELRDDPKEVFEHAVSVRSGLRELAGVCRPGVGVTRFLEVDGFGMVQHLSSTIRGRLADGATAWDVVAAVCPAVTLTGVPKPAAYDAVRRLEEHGRGLFGGLVVVYDADGSLDTAVVLRTVFQQGDRAWLQAGAGIVGGSEPAREHEETCEKLREIAGHVVLGSSARVIALCDDGGVSRETTSGAGQVARWVHAARLPLRMTYLLIGSALALSFASIDIAVTQGLWDRDPVLLDRLLVAAVLLAPPTLLGALPQLRQVEGAAAISLLGVDFGHHAPGLTRTWDQRWRTVAWFWAHLVAGLFTGFVAVVGAVSVVRLVAAPFAGRADERVLGLDWLRVSDTWRDAWLVLLAVALLLIGTLLVLVVSELLVRLAPMLLGPSVPELLAELESSTTHLVERTRLARELHDSVGHALSVVVLQSAAARRRLDSDREQALWSLGQVEGVARKALEDLDGVLGLLRGEGTDPGRPPVHDLTSLDGLVRASCEAEHDVSVHADPADLAGLPGVVSREAYRIVQEGVTNAVRHAPDQPVQITLDRLETGLRIQLVNPVPRKAASVRARGGRGIPGIRERVQIFGGRLDVGVRDGIWRLDVTLPLPRREST